MRWPLVAIALAPLALLAPAARAADDTTKDKSQEQPTESDLSDDTERKIVKKWNEYDLRAFTFKWGIYTIDDWGTAVQNEAGRSQADVDREFKVRDLRFTFSGKLPFERSVTYTMGLMYDGPSNSWFPRETGVQVAIPELWGNIFVGRQKEGISLNKITVGYAVWVMERMPISEAVIPIMADGIKWLGGLPSKRANWNFAYFHNKLTKSPSTGFYDDAAVGRFAIVPIHPDHEGDLLHLGVAYQWGKYSDGEGQLKSRPESSTAPFFLDTGTFKAKDNHVVGLESYYRNKNWLFGAEYLFVYNRAPEVGNPFFHGGEAFVAWTVTGEVRPYIDLGGKLGFVKVAHSAFDGGTGTLETVLHFSYTDLDSKDVHGGRFWRLTPQVNWYIDDMVSLRLNYGLGHLDRFGTSAFTHFFQARLQIQIQ